MPFELTFKTLRGKTFSVEVKPSDTIVSVMNKIRNTPSADVADIPTGAYRLIAGGKALSDSPTMRLSDFGITESTTVNFILKNLAGQNRYSNFGNVGVNGKFTSPVHGGRSRRTRRSSSRVNRKSRRGTRRY